MAAGKSVDAHTGDTPQQAAEIARVQDLGTDSVPRIDGPDGAPLITVHADLSCPDCAVALDRLSRIEVRIDLRHFVLRSRGEPAIRAAMAAEAAALQGAFWPFARGLLGDQGRQDPPHLWALAETLGLDITRFDEERRSEAVKPRIARETREAISGGATGVPAVFADGPIAEYLLQSGYDADVRIRRLSSSAPERG